jgi:uncharacterized protein (TIGR02001 family)
MAYLSKHFVLLVLIAILFPRAVNAENSFTANAGVTNNYLWRGLEQTNGDAAVSGGIDYTDSSGFYLGGWVSNANWADGMSYELDIYGGYSAELDSFSYDVGFVHYAYPDSVDDVDFTEVNARFSFSVFSLSYAVLADAEGVDFGDDSYISADATFELTESLNLTFNVGTGTDNFYAGESFFHYGASLNKDEFTFGVSKTDLDDDDVKIYVSYVMDIDL